MGVAKLGRKMEGCAAFLCRWSHDNAHISSGFHLAAEWSDIHKCLSASVE